MRHQFEPENVKKVFIKPQTFHNNVAFRFEFYGCTMSEFINVKTCVKYILLFYSVPKEY